MEAPLLLLVVFAPALFVMGLSIRSSRRARRDREQAARERADEIGRAVPLVALPPAALPRLESLRSKAQSAIARFDSLSTFDAATEWDDEAEAVVNAALEHRDAIAEVLARAEQAIAESHSDQWAARQKTNDEVRAIRAVLEACESLADDLIERIDATPQSKQEQTSIVKDLRAEKKELQVRKREAKQGAAAIRRAAREAHAAMDAGQIMRWERRMLAHQRRELRRKRDALVAPHESEVAAIDRQINAIDRRILWVSRFF